MVRRCENIYERKNGRFEGLHIKGYDINEKAIISEFKLITVEAVKSRQTKINCKGKVRMIWLSGELCKVLLCISKKIT